jgi:hypothetical protein
MQLHRIGVVPILPPFSLCCLDYTIIYSSLSFITTLQNQKPSPLSKISAIIRTRISKQSGKDEDNQQKIWTKYTQFRSSQFSTSNTREPKPKPIILQHRICAILKLETQSLTAHLLQINIPLPQLLAKSRRIQPTKETTKTCVCV